MKEIATYTGSICKYKSLKTLHTFLCWGKRRFRLESQKVKMVFNQPLPPLCPKPQLCYLHYFPSFWGAAEGWWELRLGEGCRRKGALEAARGIFAYHHRKWEGFLHLHRLQTTPSSQCLPTSIINCAAAAGVREKDEERGLTPCYLTYHLF